MANPASLAAARLAKAPQVVAARMQQAVRISGELLAASARRQLPAHLRNVGASGAAIGVQSSTKGTKHPTAFVRATGPAHLVDSRTRPHAIKPRRGQVLALPYVRGGRPVRAVGAAHPGTAGKHGFQRGVDEALPAAREVIAAAHARSPLLEP